MTDFTLTEDEFNMLPLKCKKNDFHTTHCDHHMTTKLLVCRMASIYSKSYSEIMAIYQTKDDQPHTW